MAEPPVLVERETGLARWVLSRPEKRNALDHATIEALLRLFDEVERDETVDVVVLAGAGPGFCAGADLTEAKGLTDEAAIRHHAELMARLLLAPWRATKPVLAEIHGFALGAGLGLALACDAVICADDARIGFPEARHGMVPALVAPSLLRRVGHATAFEILATARDLEVARAVALDLVSSVPAAEVTAVARRLALEIAAHPPGIVPALKALLREAAGREPPGAMAAAIEVNVAGKLSRTRTRLSA